MKLVRITTEDNGGLFDNDFSTDQITVKKGDEIALQSASFSSVINTLNVTAANDELKFQINVGNEKTINVKHDFYHNENVDKLFEDIELKLNNSVGLVAGKELGVQFTASVDEVADKTQIGYFRSSLTTLQTLQNNNRVVFKNLEHINQTLRKPAGAPNTTDDSSKMFQTIPFGFGSKVVRCNIRNYVDTGTGAQDNGFIFGLSEVNPAEWENSANMTEEQQTYYIKFVRNGTDYMRKVKNVIEGASGAQPSKTTGTSNENDQLELSINQGRIQARVYKSNPDTTELLFDVPYDNKTVLYPFFTFQGNQNHIRVGKMRFMYDPFIALNSNIDLDTGNTIDDIELGVNNPPGGGGANRTVNKLTLNVELASFFGYKSDITTATLGTKAIFTANEIFRATLSNVSYLIELRSIPIESFNQGHRQNIIGVIPQITDRSIKTVEYEPNNLYYITVLEDTTIRNLKARILRIDGSPILMRGMAVLTFLIKSN